MYYIGYDIGSSSVKVALVNADNNQKIAVINEPETEMPIRAEQSGWAEQDPDMWWHHICVGTQRILEQEKIKSKEIKAIGISYQMHGLVVLDQQKKVLRDAIIWCDSRAVGIGEKAAHDLGESKYGTHLLNAPGNFTASKLKWVRDNEPEIYGQIAHYMLPGDYIAYKLTGEINTTRNGLSEGILWDYKENKVADWLLEYYKIDTHLTPTIVENFTDQGKVHKEAASSSGLPHNIPVRYRAGDQPNNALSLNILKPGEVAATGGTSGVLFAITDQLASKEYSRINHFAHVNYTEKQAVLGKLLCVNGAGIQYSWLRKITKEKEFPTMNSHAKKVPIGSDGLVILPFGNGAERMLNNKDLGAQFHHLNLNQHSEGHLYRAALEGIAFSFVYGMELMQQDQMEINVIRTGNDNLFRSEIFSNTVASLIGHEIEIYDTTGAVGAARAAGVEGNNFNHFSESINTQDRVAQINPQNSQAEYRVAYEKWKKTLTNQINKN